MKFQIRDEKVIHNTVENPAAVFDRESGTLHKIGERDAMLAYFNDTHDKYRENGLDEDAEHLTYMELPEDQQEINKVFQITGYVKKLYQETFAYMS